MTILYYIFILNLVASQKKKIKEPVSVLKEYPARFFFKKINIYNDFRFDANWLKFLKDEVCIHYYC